MLTPLIRVTRPNEMSDMVSLRFNEDAYRVVAGKPLMFEESKEGILITIPKVDHHNAKSVTYKKRDVEMMFQEDFEDGIWFPIVVINEETFLIKMLD